MMAQRARPTARRLPCRARSTSSACGATSPPSRRRSTAIPWSTSTTRRPRRSRCVGARSPARELRRGVRQHPPRRLPTERARHRRARGGPRQGPPVHRRRAARARSSSSAAPPRASTWSRRAGAAPTSAPGDEIVITAHGAPLEHRALADAGRGARRQAPGRAHGRRTATCSSPSTRSCSGRAPSSSPSPPSRTRSARSIPWPP